jgi:hypothetical protein
MPSVVSLFASRLIPKNSSHNWTAHSGFARISDLKSEVQAALQLAD